MLLAAIILSVSCSDIADEEGPGGGSEEIPDTAPVCVLDFTDENGDRLKVTALTITSDNLEGSPVSIELEQPSESVSLNLISKVHGITEYEFFVVTSGGKTYRAVKQLYIPEGRRYEKTIALNPIWKKVKIKDGVVWHNYEGLEPITCEKQVINVLEMDLDNENLKLEFLYYPDREVISNVGKSDGRFIAVTNASYGSGFTNGQPVDNTYIRIDGVNYKEISIGPEDTGNWYKHEAAVWLDGSEIGFIDMPGDPVGAIEYYKSTKYPNLFSSPLLLVKDNEKTDLKSYSRSFASAKVDPRTVLAVTHDRKLLLVTIDGRWQDKAYGMTYKQAQDFLVTHFLPRYAISMDGGGSTCMYIRGKNIVNYPCEGNASDTHKPYKGTFKERGLVTFFAISEK